MGLSNRGTSRDALQTLLDLQSNCEGELEIYVRHTEGGGDIIMIDREGPDSFLIRFVPEEYGNELLAEMNRENAAGTR